MTDGIDPAGTGVCVIVAAFDAEATIARAVRSALDQPEVVEVHVVDDASRDRTGEVAARADDGSGRLRVHRMDRNAGPSQARNVAITSSQAPLIAILDADDFLLPGRFTALLAQQDWDIAADNVAFVDETRVGDVDPAVVLAHRIIPRTLDAAAFVRGSITRRGSYKGELAFLKPVLRRAFLERHGLRYAEAMRLAEDYDLYLRMLLAGARFRIAPSCGYVSVTRFGSLSHLHAIDDLRRFEQAIASRLGEARSDARLKRALRTHLRQTRRRRRHRALLERKREAGLWSTLNKGLRNPLDLLDGLAGVAADKLHGLRPPPERADAPVHFLL